MDGFNHSYQQNYSLQIYEFSRGLDSSSKDGRWVSGGFGEEIGKFNKDVPEKIKKAVTEGDFRINDNYRPKQEEYALIAREIDEYSVLAVATQVEDDKTRKLIAYRYFWLQKYNHQDIDGVGTLLIWWINAREPKFDFEWNPNSGTLNYTAQYYSREDSYRIFGQYHSKVQDILLKIKQYQQYPFAYQFNEVSSRNGLHYLALYLNQEYDIPIWWAWNVSRLEYPQRFTLICSDNEKSHQHNSSGIKNSQKPLIKSSFSNSHTSHSPVSTSSQAYSVSENIRKTESAFSSRHEPSNARNVVNTSNTLNNNDLHQIRTGLKKIADSQNVEIEMQKLAVFLENSPGISFENTDIIDNYNKGYSTTSQIRYTALLAILGYIPVLEWLKNLKELKNKKYEIDFLSIHEQLLNHSENRHNYLYERLKNNINSDISELLLKFKQPNTRDTYNYKNIEWLLLKSKSIWVTGFNEYAKELVVKLIQGGEQGEDQFYNELQQNNSQGYKNLALLFKKLPNESLSAYFYQLSEGSVPSHIYDKADTAIIPMTRKPTNKGGNQYLNLISHKIRRNPALIVTLALGCFTIGALVHSFNNKDTVLKSEKPDGTVSGQLASQKSLQSSMELYKKKNDENAKKEIQAYLEKLKSPTPNMRSQPDYKWIKKEFLPQNLKYPTQKEDYIKQTQTILNFIDYPVGTPDGVLGDNTKKLYQKFQKENQQTEHIDERELSAKQGPSTWNALTNKLIDKQVEKIATFLSSNLSSESDNEKFNESINKLKQCQTKASLEYIDCVKDNQKE